MKLATPLETVKERLLKGEALLPDTPENVVEVVGILKSYGVVLKYYWENLLYMAQDQFLVIFPFFKYFNGEITWQKLWRHWNHDRINYEFSEYCMRAMLWHGSPPLDAYLDSPEFAQNAERAIRAKIQGNWLLRILHALFPTFLPEQVKQMVYTSVLGQFWRVMSPLFLHLSDRYDRGEIASIAAVVDHIRTGLVNAASQPITYAVKIRGEAYPLVPESARLNFLTAAAVPYVEAVFFRSFPFMGTVSYNAQAYQIPADQADFNYGALYADPLPIGGAGIPPTLLMQDMRHYLPDYLLARYRQTPRGLGDLRVKICVSFQKAMFCVTTAAMQALAPYPLTSTDPRERAANERYLEPWLQRLAESRLLAVQ
ncbi:MAG: CO2 hydration protein [Gloeomargarita sp. SKYBB_i_bin120]|nr:CO2 hydration protein [Gloeomargarita sp. SKYB120]MDW8178140.1 CO2 hydration protein [Gloeomargarita sp. SKYBB_i_bin120]